jgi:hypothetical protein
MIEKLKEIYVYQKIQQRQPTSGNRKRYNQPTRQQIERKIVETLAKEKNEE